MLSVYQQRNFSLIHNIVMTMFSINYFGHMQGGDVGSKFVILSKLKRNSKGHNFMNHVILLSLTYTSCLIITCNFISEKFLKNWLAEDWLGVTNLFFFSGK